MASVNISGPTPYGTQATTLGAQANALYAGAPGDTPFLPQILQPLPDPMVLQSQYEALFPDNVYGPYGFYNQAQDMLNGIPMPQTITAPTVAPVTVAFPQGNYQALADAQYRGQFEPVQRELQLREAQQSQALQASLAQTGLADSGTGIGQQQQLARDYSEQIGAASSAIAGQAQARALEAQLTVATQQANIDIQRNLANAQLDLTAQQANARNLLERGALEAQALTTALGFDAQVATAFRDNFVQYIDTQTRAALGQSEVARAALADIFNAMLQQDALDLRAQELALGYDRLYSEEGIAQQNIALQRQQLAQQGDLANRELSLTGAQLIAQMNPGAQGLPNYPAVSQNLAAAGIVAPEPTQPTSLGGYGYGKIGA